VSVEKRGTTYVPGFRGQAGVDRSPLGRVGRTPQKGCLPNDLPSRSVTISLTTGSLFAQNDGWT